MIPDTLQEQLRFLPDYLASHLLLTFMALSAGIGLSVPLGMLATRVRALHGPVLSVVSIVQTVPGLALLALMVAALGRIGFLPAFIALALYSMLPILRNTVTGLDRIDPRVIEAARGIGMTPLQILLRVRLPLALPVIVAGIRTAAVWTVGTATLATPVGATSLGNYIFSGLQTQNYTAVTLGCVASALLAMLIDAVIRLLESGVQPRKPMRLVLGAMAVVVLFGGGIYPILKDLGSAPRIVVGGKGFTEQHILTEVIAGLLADAGLEADIRQGMGSGLVLEALIHNNVDVYVEYSGTAWANAMGREDNPGTEAIREEVIDWLAATHDVAVLGPLGFENLYALAMRRTDMDLHEIRSIDDLVPHAPQLTMAGDLEFFHRPEWIKLRDSYGLVFEDKLTFDAALMYSALREGQVDVITAYSTDGRIAAYDLDTLADPRNALLPYDALLVLSPRAAQNDAVRAALHPLINGISNEAMREANRICDVDGESVAAGAAYLLEQVRAGDTP